MFRFLIIAIVSVGPGAVSPWEPNPQHDQTWNFFRGNNYDGVSSETGIANDWPEKGHQNLGATVRLAVQTSVALSGTAFDANAFRRPRFLLNAD